MNLLLLILAVGAGGALGSLFRYGVSLMFMLEEFPIATILVNVIGSFLLGLLTGYISERKINEWLKAGIGTGFCGGFTTMSTLTADFYFLTHNGSYLQAVLYLNISLFAGMLMAFVGMLLGSVFSKRRGSLG